MARRATGEGLGEDLGEPQNHVGEGLQRDGRVRIDDAHDIELLGAPVEKSLDGDTVAAQASMTRACWSVRTRAYIFIDVSRL